MVRIAPVRLSFNPKTLWFDAGELDLREGDSVVVSTVRGEEFGHVAKALFDMPYEETKKLKSPLKPVKRVATEEDEEKSEEAASLSAQALPIFKQIAREVVPDMNPIAVEYLFNGEKAMFYFEAEDRVDFRELVRKLSSEFKVRVDMKQIGVRDGARMVGGMGHCGQELCCCRLGGEFNPVSIRMAKEQDLSLNPQKISGVCGRLMCCLRYEFDAYKDFHSRAPKKNARIQTPDGEGKVVDLDVPREIVSIKVGDEKSVKVALADMDAPEEGSRPHAVGQEAWDRAHEPALLAKAEALNLFTSQLSREDKLAEPGKVTHVGSGSKGSSKSRRRRRGSNGGSDASSQKSSSQSGQRKSRRRRSTTVKSDGTAQTEKQSQQKQAKRQSQQKQGQDNHASKGRQRNKSGNRQRGKEEQGKAAQGKTVQVGRNSSALRANRADQKKPSSDTRGGQGQRRRRRSHKAGTGDSKE